VAAAADAESLTTTKGMIDIRPETPADIANVRGVNRRAFGQDVEATSSMR
jgi:predicted N-acetyltransferase YhbS